MLPLKLNNLISLTDIWSWRVLHLNCECVFAGDFNASIWTVQISGGSG